VSEFIHDDKLNVQTSFRELAMRIWPYAKRYKAHLTFLALATSGYAVVGRVIPSVIGWGIDQVVQTKSTSTVWRVCVIYLSLEILKFFFDISEVLLFQWVGQKIIVDLRADTFQRVERLPVSYFDKTPVGRLVTRLTNDFGSLGDLFTSGLMSLISDSLSLIAILIAMLLISPKLTLIVLVVTPFVLAACIWLSRQSRDILREIKKKLAVLNSFVAENIQGIKVIQLYSRETHNFSRFKRINEDYKDNQFRNLQFMAWLGPVLSSFNMATLTLALYFGGVLSFHGEIALGALIAFLFHVQDFFPPLRNILEKYQTFQNSLTSAERIFSVLAEKEEVYKGAALPVTRLMGHIEFKNVTFAYDLQIGPVLRNVSFEIRPGESLAIVGVTGSGKSTIIGLLQRFYEIQEGSILVDGMSIQELDKAKLRRRIGVVQQDLFAFQGTLENNITLGDDRVTRDRLREAVIRAQFEPVATRLGGLEASVGERGNNLSVGERQLLNFTRALAFNPDILVLDEATANIDSQSEALIQQATREMTKGRTSIIIAHRLSTILDCDKIIVLDHGVLAEEGSHRELMDRGGLYRKLYDLQLKAHTVH